MALSAVKPGNAVPDPSTCRNRLGVPPWGATLDSLTVTLNSTTIGTVPGQPLPDGNTFRTLMRPSTALPWGTIRWIVDTPGVPGSLTFGSKTRPMLLPQPDQSAARRPMRR